MENFFLYRANVRIGKMTLIDLAGSERASTTSNVGARLREGSNISKTRIAAYPITTIEIKFLFRQTAVC